MGCKEKILKAFKDLKPSEVQAILDELDAKQKKIVSTIGAWGIHT